MDCKKVWNQYQKIAQYLTQNDLYEIVQKNEDFYDGRQWKNVKADNMPKPVINILQRVVKYLVATVGSNSVSISLEPFGVLDTESRVEPIIKEIDTVVEQTKLIDKAKIIIRNGAVDGSGYILTKFNPDIETGQPIKGAIENELVDNTQVYFGNPYSNDLQKQPWIIIALRQNIKQVKFEAEQLGVSKEEIESIKPDNDNNQPNDDSEDLVTVLIKFEKKKGKNGFTVHYTKSTKEVCLIDETDMGYKRYPLACFGWDIKKNSYLYNSPLTAVIPNQVFINKCFAIAQMYGLQSAFPKVVYDKNKVDIEKFLTSASPSAVAGLEITGKFLDFIKIPDFSPQILNLVDAIINQTKECMGVNDASLGNVKPDNTSAIIALQQASATPLEIQKAQFYEFWEDMVRNIIDVMSNTYGVREVTFDNQMAVVDFSALRDLNFQLNVDIGEGAQYSEIAQINTLDKLFQLGMIEPLDYIEAIPPRFIPAKGKIISSLKQRQEQMQQMPPMPGEPTVPGTM